MCFLGVSLGILDFADCVQVGSNLCDSEAARCKNPQTVALFPGAAVDVGERTVSLFTECLLH